jgi:hypothetical protein
MFTERQCRTRGGPALAGLPTPDGAPSAHPARCSIPGGRGVGGLSCRHDRNSSRRPRLRRLRPQWPAAAGDMSDRPQPADPLSPAHDVRHRPDANLCPFKCKECGSREVTLFSISTPRPSSKLSRRRSLARRRPPGRRQRTRRQIQTQACCKAATVGHVTAGEVVSPLTAGPRP